VQNYSFNQGSNATDTTTASEDIEVNIMVPPWDLEGIEGIWNIVIESTDGRVVDKASNFLIKLYQSVTFVLE
jgi:hypothetical protein